VNHSAPFAGSAGGVTLYVFPPAAMTSDGPQNITGYPAGGSGNYTASASSIAYGGFAFNAFNSTIDGSDFWHTLDGVYDGSGNATASATTPGFANGSWVQIQFPSAVTLYNYSIVTRSGWNNRTPYNFYVVGSNNGSTWTLVDNRTAITGWSAPTAKTFTIAAPILTAFTYFRLVTTTINSGDGSLQLSNWSLNGSLTAPTPPQAPSSNVALVLPGTSGNYVNFGRFFPSRADPSTSNIFVEAWIYLPTGATGFPFTVSDSGSEDMGFLVNYSTSALQFRVWNTAGSGINSDGNGAALASATWYHIAGSFDRTNNRVYGFVNGVVGSTVGVFSGTARARPTSNMTIGAGNSGTFLPFNGYIRDFRMVNGGIVPTTSFTPDQVPFAMASPAYALSMGTTVLALYQQFFSNGKYVVYFPNAAAATSAYYGLTFSPQTISGAMIQYRTVSNPSTYQTFLAGSTDTSIKYTNNTLLGGSTDFLG
jgi:hypothetical protein